MPARLGFTEIFLALTATLTLAGCASRGRGGSPTFAWSAPIPPPNPLTTPAFQYARMDKASCEAELVRRQIPFVPVDQARGVMAPLRLTGPLHAVAFHSALSPSQRARSVNEIADCRLVLALDDLAALLARHDIVEVVHMSMYRPPARTFPPGKIGSRHDGALALDAGRFIKRDGTALDVEKDFHGKIGTTTCGPSDVGPSPSTPEALELRAIICDAAEQHLFNVELTPDYNWAHRNHFHLEVTANVRWFLVH